MPETLPPPTTEPQESDLINDENDDYTDPKGSGNANPDIDINPDIEDTLNPPPFTDVMFGIDYLQDCKRSRDFNGILKSLDLLGAISLKDEKERESICDFEGITVMSECIRGFEECCSDTNGDDKKGSSFIESIRMEKREYEPISAEEFDLLSDKDKIAKNREREVEMEKKKRRCVDIYREYLVPKNSDSTTSSSSSSNNTGPSKLYTEYFNLMSTFCRAMKGVCLKSNLNRGGFRDEKVVQEIVGFMEFCMSEIERIEKIHHKSTESTSKSTDSDSSQAYKDHKSLLHMSLTACFIGIKALCTGNDGNKKVAAGIAGQINSDGLAKSDCKDTNVPTMINENDILDGILGEMSRKGRCINMLLEVLSSESGHTGESGGLYNSSNSSNQYSSSGKDDNTNTDNITDSDDPLQTHGIWALRTLVTDDDTRGMESMVPSAVENRDYVCNRVNFPKVRDIVVQTFRSLKKDIDIKLGVSDRSLESDNNCTENGEIKEINANNSSTIKSSSYKLKNVLSPLQWYRLEAVLLLMKEVGCHQDRIHKFVFEDNVLPLIKDTLAYGHVSIVRACLYVLRQFAFSDHMKDLFTTGNSEITKTAMLVLKKYTNNTSIVEQCFGLFSNLTLRKPQICELLNNEPLRLSAQGVNILNQYGFTHGGICTTVLFTLRNVAKAIPEAAAEMEESGIFEVVRAIYFKHEMNMARQWLAAKDIAKQLLREFREDTEGMRRPLEHNAYY